MKIAIIGSGIAGLSAAWLFHQAGHRVLLYEKQGAIGMDSHTIDIEMDGEKHRIDIPLRTFNGAGWGNLQKLYRAIGIQSQVVDLSHSISDLNGKLLFGYHNLRLNGIDLPYLKKRRFFNLEVGKVLMDIWRFHRSAKQISHLPRIAEMTIDEYLVAGGYSRSFVLRYLYPLLGTICTCSHKHLRQYPATIIMETLQKILGQSLRRVCGGTQSIVKSLVKGIDEIYLDTGIVEIQNSESGVWLRTEDGQKVSCDHIIIATQPNHAKKFLPVTMQKEIGVMNSFSYDSVRIDIHRDPHFMPKYYRDWSTLNFMIPDGHGESMSTAWMNQLEQGWGQREPIFQTMNPVHEPRPEYLLKSITMQRAVVNQDSMRAVQRLHEFHQEEERKIWFCGSYAFTGVPLLESAVQSSLLVASKLGVNPPWLR